MAFGSTGELNRHNLHGHKADDHGKTSARAIPVPSFTR